jgi:putative endonuclease
MTPPPFWAGAAEPDRMYYVYLLYSETVRQCYVGWTTDIRRRLCEHNDGLSLATRNRGPYRLVYYEAYSHKEEALGRERCLKHRPNVLKQLKARLFNSLPGASSLPKKVGGVKNILMLTFLLLVAGSFLQAAVADPSAAETQAPVAVGGTNKPAVHKKKPQKVKTAVAGAQKSGCSCQCSGSSANNEAQGPGTSALRPEVMSAALPAGQIVSPLKQAVDALAPAPVRTALDQVVLEANALAPLISTSPVKGVPPSRLSMLVGVSSFKGEVAAALAVRAELPYGFQVEAAGVLPASVSGLAEDRASVNTPTPTPVTGQVTNLSEADLALLYPFYKREGFSLEAGVGLSVAQVTSQSEWATNAGTPEAQAFQDRTLQSAFSPLVELGGNYRFTPHLSIHLDLAYLTYSNNVRTPVGQPLALSFRGLAVRPMLAWRF